MRLLSSRLWVVAALGAAVWLATSAQSAGGAMADEAIETTPVGWDGIRASSFASAARLSVSPTEQVRFSRDMPLSFDMVGLLWDSGDVEHLWLQVQDADGRWGEWLDVPVDESHGEDDGGGRPGSSPVYTGDAVGVRFAVVGAPSGADVMSIDTQQLGPRGASSLAASVPEPDPWWDGPDFVRDRSDWDTIGCRRPGANYYYSTPRAVVVHHTAASNNYSQADVPGIIRGHCVFHVQGRGWDDLAYNFMVDRFGTVWEGRTGSKTTAVRGGHTAGFNAQTSGVAMMGNFESSPPSATHLDGLRKILNWLTGWYSIDPTGSVTLYAGSANRGGWDEDEPVTVPTIVGHTTLGSTSCPGAAFHALFPALRASLVPTDFGIKPSTIRCEGRVPTIYGTLGHDRIRGTPGPDVIHGLIGNDLIYGMEGDDVICGGGGSDYLIGGSGFDRVVGDSSPDVCGAESRVCETLANDEAFFYRSDGLFRFYDIGEDGSLPAPLLAGSDYVKGWSVIIAIDLDGDGQDEMFFYRGDGLFRYYDVNPDGTLGAVINSGTGYTTGWSAIAALDLDWDGQDEIFFYRDDGLFRYYEISPQGVIGAPLLSGSGYTRNWSSIGGADLDGDGQDEMYFYRDDGLFRYYDVQSNGILPSPMVAGDGYTHGWTSITSIDLDGDAQDEMFFYRDDGLFRFYQIHDTGVIGRPLVAGTGFTAGWDSIAAIDIDDPGYATPTG